MLHSKIKKTQVKDIVSHDVYSDSSPCILLAVFDDEMRKMLRFLLNKYGYSIMECKNGIDLQNKLSALSFSTKPDYLDLVIFDMRMPGITGLGVLEWIHKRKDFPPSIMISASGDTFFHLQTRRYGAVSKFNKSFNINELLEKVMKIVPPKSRKRSMMNKLKKEPEDYEETTSAKNN